MDKQKLLLWTGLTVFALLVTAGLYFVQTSSVSKTTETKTCKEDSLQSALLEMQIEKGRYEIIIDRIREKDSAIVDEASSNLE